MPGEGQNQQTCDLHLPPSLTIGSQTPLERRLALIRLAVLLFIALLALGLGGYAYVERSQTERYATERLEVLATVMADNIQSQLTIIERQMSAMKKLMQVADPGALSTRVARDMLLDWCRSDSSCMDLLVLNAAGDIIEWTGPGTPPVVADREYVTHHVSNPASTLYIGIPQLSRVHSGRWFFAVSMAERGPDGQIVRIYVSIRDLFHSFDYGEIVQRSPGSSFAVASTGGEVYIREPNREKHMGKVIPDVDRVLAQDAGQMKITRIASRLDNIDRLIVTQRLKRFPLYVASTQEVDRVLEHWHYRAGIMGVLWVFLSMLALYVGRRLIEDARLQDYLASIDGLTGILNRRALMVVARRHEDRRGDSGGLGLLMLDVDHFKRINDTFGHIVGDDVLRHVAATLRQNSRSSDVLGRYGGEEFLMLLPGADEARLEKYGEKLRAAVEAIPAMEFAAKRRYPDTLTVSVGATVLRSGDGNLDSAIARADHALYQAKNAGRNRVVVSPPAKAG